jgi:rhodanese-related sulfurtransferase
MSRTLRALAVVVVSLAATTLAACSSTGTADAPAGSAQVTAVQPAQARSLIEDGATVIDVRTPEEFAAGHLAGATNIDVQAADFHERVGDLDPKDTYVLYCRSGSRAGAAADLMSDKGFDHQVNAGGFDSLAAAGLATEG